MFLDRKPQIYFSVNSGTGRLSTKAVLRQCKQEDIPEREWQKWVYLNRNDCWPKRRPVTPRDVLDNERKQPSKK